MYQRHLQGQLVELAKKMPIVTVTGPRQSGKTTLAQGTFANYRYVSLENLDEREFATQDPHGFLQQYDKHVILDEIQRVPELFSYLQTEVDADESPGRYILTGSEHFSVSKNVSQSLAGRTGLLRLLPLSFAELHGRSPQTVWQDGELNVVDRPEEWSLADIIFHGLYPRVHKNDLDPRQFYRDYIDTYLTRDVQALLQVEDMRKFQRFLALLAGRSGQLVNLSQLSSDVGASHTTISRWLGILEASFIISVLPPYFRNFNKRVTKSAKLYFLDTGLLCSLLRIRDAKDLQTHPLYGSIVETFIYAEIVKNFTHQAEQPPLYFWREQSGLEVDILIDLGVQQLPVEIKASQTLTSSFVDALQKWQNLANQQSNPSFLIYGGDKIQQYHGVQTVPWFMVS